MPFITPSPEPMAHIILPPGWQEREQDVTPHAVYANRRSFIKTMSLGAIGAATGTSGLACAQDDARSSTAEGPLDTIPDDAPREGYPAPRNPDYPVDRTITERELASGYNNFYEFKNQGDLKEVWPLTDKYDPFPWTLEVRGLVEDEFTMDVAQLLHEVELEERLYRFRCVEAWAMTVPWTGFPLRALVERCKPLARAKYVRFVCADRPNEMPGLRSDWYPWPYHEALRMDEATNELAFVATGLYGEPLPKQNGSPLRLVLPWKYGYKGPKAFVRLEFTEQQPPTFWNELHPQEYGFLSNVNPNIPHPRWSQAQEELLGSDEKVETRLFNGYGEWVADLYPDEPRSRTDPMAR